MTVDQVKRELRRIGLKPQRAAGQNFLLNESVCRTMVKTAEVKAQDVVLEIGPGLGVLTKFLLDSGAQVIAVELDRRLAAYGQRRFASQPNFKLIQADIFRVNLNDFVRDREYTLVANLPYSATSLVFRNFLTLKPRPSRLTVMVQSEVANRIVADAGDMSLLGLAVQYYSRPRVVEWVPARSFWPAPAVDSTVLDCPLKPDPDPVETQRLFQLARLAFAGKRKQIQNTLAAGLHTSVREIAETFVKLGLDPHLRPQDISVENWRKLAKNIL